MNWRKQDRDGSLRIIGDEIARDDGNSGVGREGMSYRMRCRCPYASEWDGWVHIGARRAVNGKNAAGM